MNTLTFAAAEPSASRAVSAARTRARIVRNLRIVFAVLIVLLAGNVLLQSILSGNGARPNPDAIAGTGERIINPRFTGRDASGSPFVLTADSAVRRMVGLGNLTDLENPRIDSELLFGQAERPDASEILSRIGVYDDRTRILRMTDTVRFSTGSGYRFQTDGASVNLARGLISGDQPVEGQAPWGAVQANGFELYEEGARLRFTGGVVTRFYVGGADRSPEED
ncbi:MAG: LPS export ABC transporter periplasmic protein LptC [Caulobacterales bacterium]|uniref:LPS export ABC transporter periplasmic protein LptC n=1 Tax=Glycocaulis sp. TaxID=1969725 RepID=UPI003F9F2CBD